MHAEDTLDRCRHILKRHASESEVEPYDVRLEIRPGSGAEGFTIDDAPDGSVAIIGDDARGLIYGTGRFLRQPAWRGTSTPGLPVRGIYFATHFHNFYHDAPIALVRQYIEELALWGVNSLSVWFDMHHFNGIEDPNARAMIKRLRDLLEAARQCEMDRGLTLISNEGYANSPACLRATGPGRGGFYGVEICPNAPGGSELILRQFSEEFAEFSDIGINHVWIWPYDQGSCSCRDCRPWGSNGYLRIARPIADLAKEWFPGCRVYLSAWYMDDEEWKRLAASLSRDCEWADGIILQPDHFGTKRNPASPLPIVGFPEISMDGMFPWGGFGANPQPEKFQKYWDAVPSQESSAAPWPGGRSVLGGWPYSEGVFEDINKVIFAQLYWNPDRPVWDIVREYAAYEFGAESADSVVNLLRLLESNHRLRLERTPQGEDVWIAGEDPGAEEAHELAMRINEKMSERTRKSWRWRIIFLRALLDAELKSNGGKPNEACSRAFKELTRIYYAYNASPDVKPPLS